MKRMPLLLCIFLSAAWAEKVVPYFKLDEPLEPLSQVSPQYPEQARQAEQEGSAIVKALVDLDGKVIEVELAKSSGYPVLDSVALEAALGWRFSEPKSKGKPAQVWISIPFVFTLTDAETIEEAESVEADSTWVDSTQESRADTVEIPIVPYCKVESKPRPVYSPDPEYPDSALQKGHEGTVIVKALVDTDGTIARTEISKSSGYPSLDQAALEAARRWTFTPALERGKPVRTWVTIPFHFSLE